MSTKTKANVRIVTEKKPDKDEILFRPDVQITKDSITIYDQESGLYILSLERGEDGLLRLVRHRSVNGCKAIATEKTKNGDTAIKLDED